MLYKTSFDAYNIPDDVSLSGGQGPQEKPDDYFTFGSSGFLYRRQEVIRSTADEKEYAITTRSAFVDRNRESAAPALQALQRAAFENENTFAALMEATKVCTLGQITHALYEVGRQYRRNM